MCSIFFFKQKTAYEMRISDWSSDVCSSDLLLASLPAPKNVDKLVGEGAKASGFQRGLQGVLRGISRVTYGRPARITTVLVALFAVGSIYTALQIRIGNRSEEHTSELQSLMRISYDVFCLKKNKNNDTGNKQN